MRSNPPALLFALFTDSAKAIVSPSQWPQNILGVFVFFTAMCLQLEEKKKAVSLKNILDKVEKQLLIL